MVCRSGDAGVGDVIIEADSGATAVLKNGFTQLADGEIDSVTPDSGQGGTKVVVEGSRLLGGGAEVTYATLTGIEAEVTSSTGTKVELIAGVGSAKTGDVKLVADTGASVSKSDGWTYLVPGEIEKVTPAVGQLGSTVVITLSLIHI